MQRSAYGHASPVPELSHADEMSPPCSRRPDAGARHRSRRRKDETQIRTARNHSLSSRHGAGGGGMCPAVINSNRHIRRRPGFAIDTE